MTNPIHPGLLLRKLLDEKCINGATFADENGLSRPLVSQITRGNRRITQNTAQKIVTYFKEGDVVEWLRLQQEYDLWAKTQDTQAPATANA